MEGLRLIIAAFLAVLPLCESGTIYFVDGKSGDDSARGTRVTNAFKTIQKCINKLRKPVDECHIRKGRYHQPNFQISGKRGSLSQPIVIRGYRNEIPIIDGTTLLKPNDGWKPGKKGVDSAQIKKDVWQLFVDGEMMTNARWPNALWSDKTVFSNKYLAKSASSSTREKWSRMAKRT